jgi:uncharacterized membrane protein
MDQKQINRSEWQNPEHWTGPAWCSVYFSKRDSRVWVPKQIPAMGWTLNMGQPGGVAWLMGIVVGLPLLIVSLCLLGS